jgi:hypothetical protein
MPGTDRVFTFVVRIGETARTMRLVTSFRRACTLLAIIAATLPPPAYAGRDICVKILQPVRSVMAVIPGPQLSRGAAKQSEVWTVEVAVGDCNTPPATGGGTAPSGWPPLSLSAALRVSSGGTAVCSVTAGVTAGGPMRKPFRFELKYPPRDPGQTSGSVTTQALPIPYVIQATAQASDDTPANNQGIATFRFAPGGTASCLAWK